MSVWGFVTARSAGTQPAEAWTRRGTKRHGRSPSAGRAAHTRKKATRRSGDATRDEALRAKPERRTRRAHAQHEKAGTRRGTKRYGRSPRGGRAAHTRTTPRRGRAAGRSVKGEAHAEDAARPREQHAEAGTRRVTKRYGRSPRGGRAAHARNTQKRGRDARRSVTGEARAEDAPRTREQRQGEDEPRDEASRA